MAEVSERMQKRFVELARRFAEQLPQRTAELEEAWRSVRSGSGHAELHTLRNLAHRLAGTGATFGYAQVSRDARLLESAVDEALEALEAEEPPSADQLRAMCNLIGAIRAVAEAANVAAGDRLRAGELKERAEAADELPELETVETDARVPAAKRDEENEQLPLETAVLYDNLEDEPETRQMYERLSFFGFDVRPLDALAESALTAEQPAVVFTEAARLDRDLGGKLAAYRSQVDSGAVKLVCFSNTDNVDVRLNAVRAGAAAFIWRPVDLVQLIDRIEGFTNRRDDEPYHILLIDDDPEQVSHVALILQQAGMVTSVVTNPRHVFSAMIDARPELILLDMYLGDCTGVELTRVIRQQEVFVGVPIVYLSVESDREKQTDAIAAGADDFLTKPIDPEQFVRLVSARCRRTRAMRYYMERDSLTGLRDHSSLIDRLTTELQRASRLQTSVCFAMLDLDHFKRINDRHGHLVGDRVLKTLSRLLEERLRKTDVVGRWGGEEFGIILLDTDVEQGASLMNEVREQFGELVHQVGRETFQLTFSCGVAAFPGYDGVIMLTEAADRALYSAKERGRNRVVPA